MTNLYKEVKEEWELIDNSDERLCSLCYEAGDHRTSHCYYHDIKLISGEIDHRILDEIYDKNRKILDKVEKYEEKKAE